MKKVLIVEDKEIHRITLKRVLEGIDENFQIYVAGTLEEAYKLSIENTINLFLVDIILDTTARGDVSGLKFAESIRAMSQYSFTPLIFITSLEDPQLHAYRELNCLGYIEKPFDPVEVKNLIEKAFKFPEIKQKDKTVFFRKEGIVYSVKAKDIIYIESSRRKLVVHTTKEVLTVPYKTCSQILEELESDDFIQCSRYTIINKNYVESIDYVNRFIKLEGEERDIEIGISMKKKVKDELGD